MPSCVCARRDRYFFTHVPSIPPYPGGIGACHFCEVAFVFHFLPLLSGTAEVALSDAMGQYWSSFASEHVPQPHDGGVQWPRFSTVTDECLQLDAGVVQVVAGVKARECDVWDRLQ